MTNRQHTPGPWYVGTEFNDQGRHIYAAQKVRHEDGDEWHPLIANTDDDERLVDWQANAVLIASAPDLLEALKDAVSTQPADSPIKWVLRARAAIAKATSTTTGASA
jgi:hypothetical protein